MMPPRMSTVRVVPTPRGCGLVEVTLVIALAQRDQASASASTETFAGKLQVTIRENHRSTRPIRSAAPSTDYADTALDNALSTIDQWILPDQIQLIADLAYAF